MKLTPRKVVYILLSLFTLFIFAHYTSSYIHSRPKKKINVASNREDFPLLATRIFIEDPTDPIVNFSSLREQLSSHVEELGINGSIYFEYLPTGTSVRVGADKTEVAASLLKLPAAMQLYRSVEDNKVDLKKTITIKQEWLDPAYGQLYKKGAGYSLSLQDAIKVMLIDSDNTALKAVASNIPSDMPASDSPFTFLDVDILQNRDLTVSISARSYSSILKCLYFSCYLDKDHSEELLEYLSRSTSKSRLPAGVHDKSTVIAHKIGNYAQDTQSDCGIVYIPKRNYILCVMLKANDSPEGDKKIADISKIVYDFMASLPD